MAVRSRELGSEPLGSIVGGGLTEYHAPGTPSEPSGPAVHEETASAGAGGTTKTVTLTTPADEGDLLVAFHAGDSHTNPIWPDGWLLAGIVDITSNAYGHCEVRYKFAEAGEDEVTLTQTSPGTFAGTRTTLTRYSNAGDLDVVDTFAGVGPSSDPGIPSLTPSQSGEPVLLFLAVVHYPDYDATLDDDYTIRYVDETGGGSRQRWGVRDRIIDEASGTYGPAADWSSAGGETRWSMVHAAFGPVAVAPPPSGTAPVAYFTIDLDPITGVAILTDGSTGDIDSWAWDLGDGSADATAGPVTHDYSSGAYIVSLTVTGPDGSDTYTAELSILEPATDPPGVAVLELYVTDPAGARWGTAMWGNDQWASTGWEAIDDVGVEVDWQWGVGDPDEGILAVSEADECEVSTFDPDRILDPGNSSSPFYPHVRDGTPIRLRHRESIIRTGIIDTVTYDHEVGEGRIAATSDLAILRRAVVEAGTILPSTLRAMARTAISAAGLAWPIVEDDTTTDPPITTPDTTDDASVWSYIERASQETLRLAWLDRDRRLRFPPYVDPPDSGLVVPAELLVDVQSIASSRGLYSVIRALDEDTVTVTERAATPTPDYGVRVYERIDPTIDSGDWADAVLADRAVRVTRYRPGRILPLTGSQVDTLAGLRLGTVVGVLTDAIDADGILLGDRVRVLTRREGEDGGDPVVVWAWYLQLATRAEG